VFGGFAGSAGGGSFGFSAVAPATSGSVFGNANASGFGSGATTGSFSGPSFTQLRR